jgi:hypothetical protein
MGVFLFTHSKIENRKCFRFFQKIKSQKVLFLEKRAMIDEIGVDGSNFVYSSKNRK